MSLSRAAGAASGASRVFVPGHCPCCSDGVGVAVAVAVAAVAVAAVVLVVTVVTVAVAAAASWSCMAAERASTLSAAESMAYGGEGEGGSCYLALGRCRGSSHISPAISSTARYINSHFVSPSPSPSPSHPTTACRPDSPSPVSPPAPAPRCGSSRRAPLPPPPGSSSDVPPPASSSASRYNSQTATKVYVLYSSYYPYYPYILAHTP